MEEFKNLKEIIELCKEELENNDENTHATLDLVDLKELENLINKNKELEKNLDKVEGKCGELFAVLFTVIRNNTVLPKGEELGKSQIEITQMTVKTIDALIEKIDYEKVRDLLKEAGEM